MEGLKIRQSGEYQSSIVKEFQTDLIQEGLLTTSEFKAYADEFYNVTLAYIQEWVRPPAKFNFVSWVALNKSVEWKRISISLENI
jgi:hypothetical protein